MGILTPSHYRSTDYVARRLQIIQALEGLISVENEGSILPLSRRHRAALVHEYILGGAGAAIYSRWWLTTLRWRSAIMGT